MFNRKKISILLFSLLIHLYLTAQTVADIKPEKQGFLRSEGKIYVVMVVAITILAGLLLYIYRLDRKMSKIEKGQ